MANLVHITPYARSGGGMQTIVRQHRAVDAALGHRSAVAALFEDGSNAAEIGLQATGAWSPARLARGFRNRIAPATQDAVAIYHNAWGMPLLAPVDGAARRLAYLHTDWPGLNRAVDASARWADGFIAASDGLVAAVRRAAPGYPADRIWRISYPVSPPAGLASGRGGRVPDSPFRVAYVGRLDTRQKRVDRLERMLRDADPGIEWHVVGEGPARRALEAAASPGAVTFHGWLQGRAYWEALAGLDAVVFFSDFEGTPLVLLDAMSMGAVPLFPGIGGGGEELAGAVDRRCVYPPGDLAALRRQLKELLRDGLVGSAVVRAAVSGHTPAAYAAAFARIVEATTGTPRHSAAETPRAARWSDRLPMAVVHRWYERAIWC